MLEAKDITGGMHLMYAHQLSYFVVGEKYMVDSVEYDCVTIIDKDGDKEDFYNLSDFTLIDGGDAEKYTELSALIKASDESVAAAQKFSDDNDLGLQLELIRGSQVDTWNSSSTHC